MASAGDLYTADSIQLWLYNGNARSKKLVRSWEESEFQTTLAAQHSKDFEMLVGQYAAALGTRGDYFLLEVPLTGLGTTVTTTSEVGHLYLDFMDILGVPNDVQLGKRRGYGKYSPFDSPDVKVTDEMKVGIESERLALVLNKSSGIATSWVSQYIGGEADARLQTKYDKAHVAGDATHIFYLRLKPTSSNVFLIRYDSKIWVLPANATTGNAFVEDED